MIRRTLGQIAAMIGGECKYPETGIAGVSIDTRSIQNGNLFVPLRGKNFDGHSFVPKAFMSGAAASLWSVQEPGYPRDMPLILVEDTLSALQKLAAEYRKQLSLKIVGITGSNGKTSTKDILAAILSVRYKTKKNQGNLNNHIGVPLTLLDLDEDTGMGVVEMGMSGLDEIRLLSQMAKPDIAIITNVAEAHLADLGSVENIAKAKLEILEGLKPQGVFIANGDYPLLHKAIEEHQALTFGEGRNNCNYPTDICMQDDGISFHLNSLSGKLFLPLLGRHQVLNATAAITAAQVVGMSYDEIRNGLLKVETGKQRGELMHIGGSLIINDTYKSNPSSVKAALDTLYSMQWSGRKVIVLGDMRDLGNQEKHLHEEIGALLDPGQIDTVITVGDAAAYIAEAARSRFPAGRVIALAQKDTACSLLAERIKKEPVLLLIKGAHVLALDDLVQMLERECARC